MESPTTPPTRPPRSPAVRRAEAEAAAAHLNRVFAQAPVVIAVVAGPDHVFETVNPKFLELTGGGGVLGKPARRDIPADTHLASDDLA